MFTWLFHARRHRVTIYTLNLLISLHYFLVIYINSAYLSRYIDARELSQYYLIGSVLGLMLFFFFAYIVRLFGNYHVALILVLAELSAIIGMGFGSEPTTVIAAFVVFLIVSPALYLTLDIFLEKLTLSERITGSVRGTFLTMQNIAQVVCPLAVGYLVAQGSYTSVYVWSAVFLMCAACVMVLRLNHIKDARYRPHTLFHAISYTLRRPKLYHALLSQLLLRFFYAWMVIYTPLYLIRDLGFSWDTVGTMFAIMLLPFLLFELPLGKLADTRWGEKEIMIIGFILMAATVSFMPFLPSTFIAWTSVLFISRIGAACVEIASESYFFRHVKGGMTDTISLFRATRPMTYILAAGAGATVLTYLSLEWSFLVPAGLMIVGALTATTLKDSR